MKERWLYQTCLPVRGLSLLSYGQKYLFTDSIIYTTNNKSESERKCVSFTKLVYQSAISSYILVVREYPFYKYTMAFFTIQIINLRTK